MTPKEHLAELVATFPGEIGVTLEAKYYNVFNQTNSPYFWDVLRELIEEGQVVELKYALKDHYFVNIYFPEGTNFEITSSKNNRKQRVRNLSQKLDEISMSENIEIS